MFLHICTMARSSDPLCIKIPRLVAAKESSALKRDAFNPSDLGDHANPKLCGSLDLTFLDPYPYFFSGSVEIKIIKCPPWVSIEFGYVWLFYLFGTTKRRLTIGET